MRQVLWTEQRRRRALHKPEADTEAAALGTAAAFCMRAAVSDGEQESAEDSGDEESVLDLWGDDPGDFTDSEVYRVCSKQRCFEREDLYVGSMSQAMLDRADVLMGYTQVLSAVLFQHAWPVSEQQLPGSTGVGRQHLSMGRARTDGGQQDAPSRSVCL